MNTIFTNICTTAHVNTAFFWFDLLGTLSTILDFSFVGDAMVNGIGDPSVLRAARVAKLGARGARFTKEYPNPPRSVDGAPRR